MLIGVALIPWIIRHPRSAAGALRGAHDNGPGRPVEDALRRIVVCLLRRVRVACGADHVPSTYRRTCNQILLHSCNQVVSMESRSAE